MNDPILHDRLPKAPWLDPAAWRLPGVQPLDPGDWLIRDEAFAAQMALRDRLIAEQTDRVHAILPDAEPAALECLNLVLETLRADTGYRLDDGQVARPDGVTVTIDRACPLITLGRLVQSDICLMQAGPDGHILTGAILCFPAGWTLSQKIGRALDRIHAPVPTYDESIVRRVQRLFDAIRPGQVLWRANAHLYQDPTLFAPRMESDPRPYVPLDAARFVRSERQTLRRLPDTGAVVFTIHTYMIPLDRLDPHQRAALAMIA